MHNEGINIRVIGGDVKIIRPAARKVCGLPHQARGLFGPLCTAQQYINLPLEEMRTDRYIREIEADSITFIHDKHDKIIPYRYSGEISNNHPAATLIPIEDVGHYRMLWNKDVLDLIEDQFLAADSPQTSSSFTLQSSIV